LKASPHLPRHSRGSCSCYNFNEKVNFLLISLFNWIKFFSDRPTVREFILKWVQILFSKFCWIIIYFQLFWNLIYFCFFQFRKFIYNFANLALKPFRLNWNLWYSWLRFLFETDLRLSSTEACLRPVYCHIYRIVIRYITV